MKTNAKRQGHLDGLCGVYSIINAYKLVMGKTSTDVDIVSLFQECCRSVSSWPRTLWEGLDFDELEEVIARTQRAAPEIFRTVEISFPFKKSALATSEEYWNQFHELFGDVPSGCAIIGMTYPDMHWVAVRPKSKMKLQILDPSPLASIRTKNISQIHAGDRRPAGKHWMLARNELVFFRKTQP